MILRLPETRHGFDISEATNEEFHVFQKNYPEKIHCVICNSRMANNLRIGILGQNIITINNRVHDGVIFVNHFF